MKSIKIIRGVLPKKIKGATLGQMFFAEKLNGFGGDYIDLVPSTMDKIYTLEPPWKDNKRNKSCIPFGGYKAKIMPSGVSKKAPYPHIEVMGTEPRTDILFHRGNYVKDTKGCILPGMGFIADKPMVTNSRVAMDAIMSWLQGETEIELIIQEV